MTFKKKILREILVKIKYNTSDHRLFTRVEVFKTRRILSQML